MPKDRKQFYNDLYQKTDTDPFGDGNPLPIVEQIPTLLRIGTVIDIGCGMGRNSIYLAQQGFSVTAIDFSKKGIERLQQRAREKELQIHAIAQDVTTLSLETNVDCAVISYVLHQIPARKAKGLIYDLKAHTTIGGIHAIAAFTKKGDFYKREKGRGSWYLEQGELKAVYANWDIISYEERKTLSVDKRGDGTPYTNLTAFLLAKKV